MKNLIMADLKVLGHRIWAVPLSVFLFIFSFSFVPYLDQVYKFQNWIFAILIPELLTYELFREEQKNSTGSFLMTMPVSKEKYVWSKYLIITAFVFTGIIIALMTDLLLSSFNMVADNSQYDFYDMKNNNVFQITFMMFMLVIPIFYLTRNILLSILSGITIFLIMSFGFIFADSYLNLFFWRNSHDLIELKVYMTSGLIFILILAVIVLLKGKYIAKINNVLFAIFILIFLILFANFIEQIDFFLIYSSRLEWFSTPSSNNDYYYIHSLLLKNMSIIQLSLMVLVIIIICYLIKRKQNNFSIYLISHIYSPVFFLVFLKISTLYTNYKSALYILTAYIGLLIFFITSSLFSIYLLKNNRTLK